LEAGPGGLPVVINAIFECLLRLRRDPVSWLIIACFRQVARGLVSSRVRTIKNPHQTKRFTEPIDISQKLTKIFQLQIVNFLVWDNNEMFFYRVGKESPLLWRYLWTSYLYHSIPLRSIVEGVSSFHCSKTKESKHKSQKRVDRQTRAFIGYQPDFLSQLSHLRGSPWPKLRDGAETEGRRRGESKQRTPKCDRPSGADSKHALRAIATRHAGI